MIWIDRYRKENGKVIRPADSWFEEAEQQTQKAVADGPGHEVTGLYRHNEVKMALEKLFHDKCAYCESQITTADPWDVEHFRPKGKVAEQAGHPGYYWLAYTWENLYPSCVFCNRNRKDTPRYDDPEMREAQGKSDRFPIENEENRAMTPDDDISKEVPLLLDPNNKEDDPGMHFTYNMMGEMQPRVKRDRFAEETIRICHLNRRRLRDARACIIKRASRIMKLIKIAKDKKNDAVVGNLQEILDDYLAPEAVYIGAVRSVIRTPDAFIGG